MRSVFIVSLTWLCLQVDFIMKYGYPGEMHEIQTKDGYILTLHRIPHNGTNFNANRPVVLLQHGIVLSSDQWVLRGTQDLGEINLNNNNNNTKRRMTLINFFSF